MKEDNLSAIHAAHARISDIIIPTPLMESKWLSSENGCNIFLKLESEQITGSFKLRGATNKLKVLCEQSSERLTNETVVTASSGNHGLACAYVSSKLNLKMAIYSNLSISSAKEEMFSLYENVELRKFGEEAGLTEIHAREEARKKELIYISPYNDLDVIHGQATVAVEMLKQNTNIDVVIASVGGGGLVAGIAMYIKLTNPKIKVIACQPANDCCMYESIKANHIIEEYSYKDTISDGTAGSVEPGAITFDLIKQYVDEWVLVEEGEIELAVYDMMLKHNKIIEGAAGCVIACARKIKKTIHGKIVALVVCGANLGVSKVNYLLKKYA